MNIFLFCPMLMNNEGINSTNLGDLIIHRSVMQVLHDLFPACSLQMVSTHVPIQEKHIKDCLSSGLTIVCGTNLLSSHISVYNQWKIYDNIEKYSSPDRINAILLGVGWWQYQDAPDAFTAQFYRSILHPNALHSVRDTYTKDKLTSCGIYNVLNTSCMTFWGLDGKAWHRLGDNDSCLFCLTDYMRDPVRDNKLIKFLSHSYKKLYFFPQGKDDLSYLHSLDAFYANRVNINILCHNIKDFFEFIQTEQVDYIGTRLHAGAACLMENLPVFIIGIDNRAIEIAKDINIPVLDRNNIDILEQVLSNYNTDNYISLPTNEINSWKKSLVDIINHDYF